MAGKLAQLGSRLIDATAKMLAGQFFERFGAIVAPPVAAEVAAPADAPGAGSGGSTRAATATSGAINKTLAGGVPSWVWLAAVAVVALAVIWLRR